MTRHLIIGNSAAGVTCAEVLRRLSPDDEIVVVSDEPEPAYSRCLLSYFLAGQFRRRQLTIRDLQWYSERNIKLLLGRKAVGLDLRKGVLSVARSGDARPSSPLSKGVRGLFSSRRSGGHEVNTPLSPLDRGESHLPRLDDGGTERLEIPFDKLLVATGASSISIPIPGIEQDGVFHLRTLAHADSILAWLRKRRGQVREVAVLGAGFIGMKAACALWKRGLRVTVIEKLDRLMPRTLDVHAARIVRKHLERHGVRCIVAAGAAEIPGGPDGPTGVQLDKSGGGRVIPAQMIIVAVGVRPNTEFLAGTGISALPGIRVDEFLSAAENVYAAGDVAETVDLISGRRTINAIWPCAVAQGKAAAYNMAGIARKYEASMTMNSVELLGLPVLTLGAEDKSREDCKVQAKMSAKDSIYKKLVYRDGKLVGAILVGEIERAGVLLSLIKKRENVEKVKGLLKSFSTRMPPGWEKAFGQTVPAFPTG